MKDIKCLDCDEYRNEWCEKIVDSPYPDIIRDCQYWHKRKDMVEVIRCKDCKYWTHIKRTDRYWCKTDDGLYDLNTSADDFCSRAERRTDEPDR